MSVDTHSSDPAHASPPLPGTITESERLVVGEAYSLGKLSEGRVMALAAASVPGSTDLLDQAASAALATQHPTVPPAYVEPGDVDPVSDKQRWQISRVRGYELCPGEPQDLVVMRGPVDAVLNQAKLGPEGKSLIRRNADWALRHGWRTLAVATAPVDGDKVGEFRVQGFITVGVDNGTRVASTGPADWARVNLWSISLRYQHWANVALIFILSCTGYLIMDPFFGPEAYSGEGTGIFLMGWVRFIHFTAAFLWVILGATRVFTALTSRDAHLRASQFWPLKRKRDVQNLGKIVKYYLFISREEPLYLGHNPLQQLAYSALYVACGVQMLTGFSLYALYHQDNPFWAFIALPVHLVGIPAVRLFHAMLMFGLWCFVVMHVYLAVRADSLERHGGLSAMINGGVWMRRGSRPEDAPAVE
ncbi:MAG: Ni/Fe-hydrogenase, b-type cytochrome subunit [Propionibacteriaceae bacterium]|jgi:Ni/Fe-hydrogenase b-type cytochrome subunit|nr:Ni/Fe-hydrogenase, b-type cytochrome subunit [Propionibacteriaceae bacterium]